MEVVIVSLNDLLHNDGDRESRGLVHPLLVYITQVTACSVHHIPNGDFWEQPVRGHGGIQLGK